ncbi:hypothetical protein Gotri_004454 [Gossypium trilobum]|uniref:Uncharacterized protein n=1 Tax=Gossypium trilobum TaxID=34281 RepID=A0A7J9F4V6_9ROSI|nr:hypothetical protein [Gossypium trilobum]
MDCSLSNLIASNSSWNLDLFRLWVPEEIIDQIVSVPPPHPSSGLNRIIWRATSTNTFSLNSAYGKVCEGTLNPNEVFWRIPWKFKCPHRTCFFIWLVLKQMLLTNIERIRRGSGSSSACGICGHVLEDMMHTLKDCLAAKGVWDKIIPKQTLSSFYSGSLLDWMATNLQNQMTSSTGGIDWSCLFGIIAWRIWKNRNMFVFQGISWSVEEIIKISFSWAKQYSSISLISKFEARSTLPNWPMSNSWVCLNTGGSVKIDEGFAATGGCVRDHKGEWIIGFARYLGNCSVLEVEFLGILDGLNLTADRCFQKFLIQTDSIEAIEAIMEDDTRISNSTIIRRIHHMLKKLE